MAKAWMNFLKAVDQAKNDLGSTEPEECFFRGHEDVSWELLPTLLRHCKIANQLHPMDIRRVESSLYFEFRARARELHNQAPTEWDILFSMRHHGVATRLLDWTETLGVAIYFALRNIKDTSQPCLWILNPYALNEESWGDRDLVAPEYLPQGDYDYSDYLVGTTEDEAAFDWSGPVALYPIQRDARLQAQRGYFTIHGNDVRALDKIYPHLVKRIDIPPDTWKEAQIFLRDAGIDELLMFPDLDGLARHLHRKYQIR